MSTPISEQGSVRSVPEHFQDIQNRKHAEAIDECMEIISELEERQALHWRKQEDSWDPGAWILIWSIGLLASAYIVYSAANAGLKVLAIWGFIACLVLVIRAYRRKSRNEAREIKIERNLDQARRNLDSMVRLAEEHENQS